MRTITETGLKLIKSFEGHAAFPYQCSAGYLAIGHGHVMRSEESFAAGITNLLLINYCDKMSTLLNLRCYDSFKCR